ncbi:hypothetical protein GCM10027093_04130 [Paraburkholderia jirisanensis]
MLRVTVELFPDGDEALARPIAQLSIVNDDTGTAWTGHYDVMLTYFERDGATFTRTVRLQNFDRERPAMDLVAAALSVVHPVRRGMAMFPQSKPLEPR